MQPELERTPAEARECRDCGLRQEVPELEEGSVAHCERCDAVLRRASRHSTDFPLVCACIAAFLFFFVALEMPLMTIKAPGNFAAASVFDGPAQLFERGHWPVAIIVLLTLVVFPGLKLVGLLTVLFGVRAKEPPPWLGRVFRWTKHCSPWSMIEVFLLGAAIAYTRLEKLASVAVHPALWALLGVVLATVAAEATLDAETIWDAAERSRNKPTAPPDAVMCEGCGRLEPPGEPCHRCGAHIHARKPNALARAWALLLAAFLLYIPANVLPVMTVHKLGQGEPHTIMSGVIELGHANLWPLAALVFCASFLVPMFKLVGMLVMLVCTHFGARAWLRGRTRLFRFIDAIGRWSMIDVFMLANLVGLVHFGYLSSVLPNWGATAFAGVVVLTMFCAESFDPRLMWDAVQRET